MNFTEGALAVHNLGLAAGFGGSLFGQTALHPALDAVRSKKERGALVHRAWHNYSPANLIGLAAVGITWLAGRSALSGGAVGNGNRGLVYAKDALVGIYTLTGVASWIVGSETGDSEPPMEKGDKAAAGATATEAVGLKTVNWLGRVNIAAAAGIIAITAILNVRAGRSTKWTLLSALLP